jgi:hypothetical protein
VRPRVYVERHFSVKCAMSGKKSGGVRNRTGMMRTRFDASKRVSCR